MDFETQLNGLNDLLALVYGSKPDLPSLLSELGFEASQVSRLEGTLLQSLVSSLIDSLHKRLVSPTGKDTWFHFLRLRYGLDGTSPRPPEQIAAELGMDINYMAQITPDILAHCRTKSMQIDLKKELKQIAVSILAKSEGRPSREHVAEKLKRLSNLKGAADVTRLDYEAKRKEILSKVQAELDALEVEYSPLMTSVEENIADLENEIKTDVLLHGESVTGGSYRAVITRGRVSWDNENMEKYASAHPEVLAFRKQGAPVVSLRVVSEKD
jgi:hypothetical protein